MLMLRLSGKIIRWFVPIIFKWFVTGVMLPVLTNADNVGVAYIEKIM
jgi:hypothetical protein